MASGEPAELYLDLLKRVLTRTLEPAVEVVPLDPSPAKRLALAPLKALTDRAGIELVRRRPVDMTKRELGQGDPPPAAETMIGLVRLGNLQDAVRTVIDEQVPGDVLEAGVWRGGASIFARACLKVYGGEGRRVWLADSFAGLPKPSTPQDEADAFDFWKHPELAVGVDQVRANFDRYGLLDSQVMFLVGWFADTLPGLDVELAVLRLDGDLYTSTMEALVLYDKVAPGGFVIVDDYHAVPACKQAITDFRESRGIDAEILEIDGTGVYWRKAN